MLARMLMAVLAALAVAACGGDGGETLDGPVSYVRGGGETGEVRELTVRPDGAGTFVVERGLAQPGKPAIRLTADHRPEQLDALEGELSRLAEKYGPSEP